MPRPVVRVNAEGLWRCGRCGGHFPADGFWVNHRRAEPQSFCKPCKRAWDRRRKDRLAMDEGWWRAELERQRPYVTAYQRKRTAARQEEREERRRLARWLLTEIRARGLTALNVQGIAGLSGRAQKRIEAGEGLWRAEMLDRLLALHEACAAFPRLRRMHGSRSHPHLAEITYRYRALREALA